MNDQILIINKPRGLSSFDVIRHLRRFGIKKAGHIGTLDPMAEGVLVVFTGKRTKEIPQYEKLSKEYEAEITFGTATDTLDSEGAVTAESDAGGLDREALAKELTGFMGKIKQIPPMHSALHHKGERLYDLARQGITVERPAREVEIFELELLDFAPGAKARAEMRARVSSGTYIRTLAEDIGKAVGLPAHLSKLVRTRVGDFKLEDAKTLEELELLIDGAAKE